MTGSSCQLKLNGSSGGLSQDHSGKNPDEWGRGSKDIREVHFILDLALCCETLKGHFVDVQVLPILGTVFQIDCDCGFGSKCALKMKIHSIYTWYFMMTGKHLNEGPYLDGGVR